MTHFLTITSEKPNYFHKLFYALKSGNSVLLLLGVFIWISFPALGIIPLLLFLQSNVSYFFIKKGSTFNVFKPGFLSALVLVLVFATITIISCFREIEGDLQVYVNSYTNLGNDFGDILDGFQFEPVSYIIPYLAKLFFNLNDDFSFLLIQSTTMNLAFTAIAIKFIPQYFPVVILLNITSISYFSQLYLMRQFYSFIFLLLFIFDPLVITKLLFGFLSVQTHNSSLYFVISSILYTFTKDFRSVKLNFLMKSKLLRWIQRFYSFIFLNSKFLYFIVILLIVLIALNSLAHIFDFLNYFEFVLPELVSRVNFYQENREYNLGLTEDLWKGTSFNIFYLSAFIIFSNLNLRKINDSVLASWIITFLVSIVSLVGFYSSIPLLGRIVFFLTGLPGFFYVIIFSSGKLTAKANLASFILILAISTNTLYYLYRSIYGSNDYIRESLFHYIKFIISNIS